MPRLYIRPATHVLSGTNNRRIPTDTAASQMGTPNGILIIIATGEVNGITESQVASDPDGSLIIAGIIIITNIRGIVIGSENCCAFVSTSTNAPTPAKRVA